MKDTIIDIFARAISFLLFPLFMPLYGLTLLFQIPLFSFFPRQYVIISYYFVVLMCVLMPFFSYWLMAKFNIISSAKMLDKKDRFYPMFVTAVFFFGCAFMLCRYAMPLFIVNLLCAVSVAILITAIVSVKWKISAHLTGIGGLIASIFIVSLSTNVNSSLVVCVAVLSAGLLAAARLQLNRHTPMQLIAGFLNGIMCVSVFSLFDWGALMRWLSCFLF